MTGEVLNEAAAEGLTATIPAQHESRDEEATDAGGGYKPVEQEPEVFAVAGFKGGVGKSRTAQELAWLLNAVLTDFEWDWGGVTRGWGYFEEDRVKSPLIRAFQTGQTPKPLSGHGRKPDLIPGHTAFERNQPRASVVTETLLQWSRDLKRRLVVDTHPGGSESTYGAMAAARVTVVPAVLGNEELRALEGLLQDVVDYPLLLIPYKIGRAPAAWLLDELERLAEKYEAEIGPAVGDYYWIPQRRLRVPICASPLSKRTKPFVEEMKDVAEAVMNYGR